MAISLTPRTILSTGRGGSLTCSLRKAPPRRSVPVSTAATPRMARAVSNEITSLDEGSREQDGRGGDADHPCRHCDPGTAGSAVRARPRQRQERADQPVRPDEVREDDGGASRMRTRRWRARSRGRSESRGTTTGVSGAPTLGGRPPLLRLPRLPALMRGFWTSQPCSTVRANDAGRRELVEPLLPSRERRSRYPGDGAYPTASAFRGSFTCMHEAFLVLGCCLICLREAQGSF